MKTAITDIINTLKGSDPEATRSPYWIIIDPHQSFRCDPHDIASMITGIFFSRKDAADYLHGHRYNFGKHAVVYCHSGCYSQKYDALCKEIGKI